MDGSKAFTKKLFTSLEKLNPQEKSIATSIDEVVFSNQEVKVVINESVRNKDVYIVQLFDDPHSKKSVNDNIMALACAVNAAFYSEAYRVTAVIPQFPYARQDKKKGREPITAKIVGNLLEQAGCNRVITLDIHSESIEGFFPKLLIENLHAGQVIIDYIKKNIDSKNLMVIAPDVGSAKRGLYFAKKLHLKLAIIDKVRDYTQVSTISKMELVGDVEGKDVLICDDMIATGGTVISSLKLLKERGAKKIYIAVALPYFSNGVAQFKKAHEEKLLEKVIGTNSVNHELKDNDWYVELDITELFAKVIHNLNIGESVSKLLN